MTEPIIDAVETPKRPRRPRQPKAGRKVFVYRLIDGKSEEQGSFPEAVIGAPVERRLPTFLKEVFGAGDYKATIHKPNGHFDQSYDFSIAAIEPEQERIIDIEPEEFDDEPAEDFSFSEDAGQMRTAAEVENYYLKERLRRLEEDVANRRTGNQSETQTLLAALEKSHSEQRELMMLMLAQAQKPQQDATLQAMSMLEKSFGMISKARDLSEQIAPSGSNEGGGSSYIADGAKLIDSLGRNAGTFLPILSGLIPKAPPVPTAARPAAAPFPPAANGNGGGDLSDLAAKIQKKETEKK